MPELLRVPSVSVTYARNGTSTKANELGMRVMQERAYEKRGEQYLLIKSPPASGKSRALMFIALDKLHNQGLKQAIIVVPEKSIGSSFADEPLSKFGFWADWKVEPKWNLCNSPGTDGGKVNSVGAFLESADRVLVCTHATFRFAVDRFGVEAFDDRLIAVDEFHHVSAKGDMASMAHPIFSLSTKPDHRIRRYEDETGKNFVEVKPSAEGLATIHDRDVLIYCISQLIAAINDGQTPSKTLRMKAYDFLKATNRVTDGRGYDALRSALIRLQGTQIETNIVTGETEQLDIFSIIDRAKIVRQTRDGRMQEIEIQLSDWVFNAIRAKEVLTFHRDYFRLRKPIERRLYELARKHCGQKKEWRITLPVLQRKCGSSSTLREFRRLIQNIVDHDNEHAHIPDYGVRMDEDMVTFTNRGTMLEDQQSAGVPSFASVRLSPDALTEARLAAPGWDVYVLESEWRSWMADGGLDAPKNPDKAFLGFCKKWFERRGRP